MPRNGRPPSYRLHKARNLAVVTLDGKNHYLGPYGSAESHEKYARLIAEWRQSRDRAIPAAASNSSAGFDLSVNELILAYWRHVETYYVKDGRPTSEQDNIRQALRFLRRLYGHTPAREFGPKGLKAVRQTMIDADRCRSLINKDICRIRAMFRWAVEHELLPVTVLQALQAVGGLRQGRSEARETVPIGPVSEKDVEATLPHLPTPVAAMVRLQLLTAARPGEITSLRPCDLDREAGPVWLYTPQEHKTEHHNRRRRIPLGPKAQEILRPWLDREPTAYCFSPAETMEARYERTRKRPKPRRARSPTPSKGRPRQPPGVRYTKDSYRIAVKRACLKAKVTPWSPVQLRHTAATRIRAQYGLEAAQVVLGHSKADVTQVYAERDQSKANEIIAEVG